MSRTTFDWLRSLWHSSDTEIRATSYALTAVLVSDDCGRDIFFSLQNRLEEAHLVGIILDEDECSLVKEQVRIFSHTEYVLMMYFHVGMQCFD